MMDRFDDSGGKRPDRAADAALWRRSRLTDAADDEGARFLDLAAFAEGRLDSDEAERVAAWLADDPELAADVAAARNPATAPIEPAVIARAVALVPAGETAANVVPFVRIRPRLIAHPAMRWGSLAAALLLASWLGFALGSDASLALGPSAQPGDEGYFSEWLDPTAGTLGNPTVGAES
jgi:anti-sigma factor RsiW